MCQIYPNIRQLILGRLQTNVYFFTDHQNLEIIDPADEIQKILNEVRKLEIKSFAVQIILTHGHFDHIGAVSDVCSSFDDVKVYICEKDYEYLFQPDLNLSQQMPPIIDLTSLRDQIYTVKEGDIIKVGSKSLKVFEVSGHTPGSIFLVDEENKVVFTGDTLFKESIGSTHSPGSDYETLISSLRKFLSLYPTDYAVLTGYGNLSTIGHELSFNPYL
jgi:hydroxyacylglutathione hydrolase